MIDIRKISIEEFENSVYDKYITLFTQEEQRDFSTITNAYNNGIEEFYGIYDDDIMVGFFALERIKDYPYYLDYIAIFKEYQSKGYGSKSVKLLLDKIVKDKGIIGEIEEVMESDTSTVKRWNFYNKLGFKKFDNRFFFNGTMFELIVYPYDFNTTGDEISKMLYDYYVVNIGEEKTKETCKIIK